MNEKLRPVEAFIGYALGIGAIKLFPEGCLLNSGRPSPYFFDAGLFNTGESQAMLSFLYADIIAQHLGKGNILEFDLLYGPPYKGTILVPAVAIQLDRMSFENTHFCSSRKEAKEHGEGGLLIGAPIQPGSRVLIVDDVITDGGTKREAVELIRRYGGNVVGLMIAFDRQERGAGTESAAQEFTREYGVPVYSIATLADLISFYKKIASQSGADVTDGDGMLEKIIAYQKAYGMLEKIIAYQKQYGVAS